MRKILLSILLVLLVVGLGFVIAGGFQIGNFQIWGVNDIKSKNDVIDKKNLELSDLVGVTYPNSLAELETSSKTLTSTKQEYEDKAVLVSNSKYYMQTEKYEIEFLWTRLGNHAKDNNVQIKIDVVNSATSGLYDLNFTIEGQYIDVTDFIYAVENDSKLGFKIEDFHMSAVNEGVQGTFACKEIRINIEELEVKDEDVTEDEKEVQDKTATSNTTEKVESSNNTVTQTNEVTDTQSTAVGE